MSAPSPRPKAGDPATTHLGWPFWQKRLARALVIGALALIAAQLLPAFPEDQLVRLRAPAGVQLTRAALTYYSEAGGEALSGTELVPADPAPYLTHTVRLPSADYRISIQAVGADSSGLSHHYSETQTVSLSGSIAEVLLHTSKPRD